MSVALIAGPGNNFTLRKLELFIIFNNMIGYRDGNNPVACLRTGVVLENRHQLNTFFVAEEQKAFKVARFSVGNDDDALDVIQDAMLKFVSKYAHKAETEWKPLFYKIIYSHLTDFHRRKNFRSGIMRFFGRSESDGGDEVENIASPHAAPEEDIHLSESLSGLHQALESLPLRQQQAVLMRAWHGFDTKETANIMQVSDGSVKTHYSRGLARLKELLGEQWP